MHSFKTLNRTRLRFENNLKAERLLPWSELNAPFEGSWCIVDAHTSSLPHAHHEYEIFIALKGNAFIVCDGQKTPFNAGDIVQFSPYAHHSVVNESELSFEMYSVWWNEEMSQVFAERHKHTSEEYKNA